MKKIIYSVLIFSSFLAFFSCNEITTEDPSVITYFVDLSIEGDDVMLWAKGTEFVEPGYKAISNDIDVTTSVVVTGSVDVNKPGIYSLRYSATNSDGYQKVLTRTVMVYDTTESPIQSGYYFIDNGISYRLNKNNNTTLKYGSAFSIVIIQIEPGVYYTTDFLGGWYDQRANYGPNYACTGEFKLNADNSLELLSSFVAGWGDSLDGMANASYDPADNTIYWEVDYAGFLTFFVKLTN